MRPSPLRHFWKRLYSASNSFLGALGALGGQKPLNHKGHKGHQGASLAHSLLLIFWLLASCSRSGPPYSPKEALKTFKIEPGFQLELFVAEPMVTSPVAMDFDEQGRIFVVEMPGYPLDTESHSGRVKLLEDTDGDGRPDRSTVFADGLVLPTGVMRWKNGILVTDAPNVWYFEDTNGDGRADVRRVVLTGFPLTNPQHTVNSPVYGLDNWIYLAHEPPATAVIFKEKFGDRGSDIRFPDRADIPAVRVGRNIRFRPDRYQLEVLSGSSQFGHAFDEWGHHFTLNNSDHVRHEVIAARYLKRNPDLLLPSAMQDISDHGAACEVFPITHNPQHQMLTEVGQITSACSLTLCLGGAFPAAFEHASLVAEPAHNLVHEDIWSKSGSTFVAKRTRKDVEFLASTDSWFRPVNFYIGPDGAIYMLDYYRQIIEHPEWMSSEHHHGKELYKGSDRGRIYRIVPDSSVSSTAPEGRKQTEPRPSGSGPSDKSPLAHARGPEPLNLPKNIHLDKASDEELVRQLENPNIWWRRTAQRLLVDRQSAGSVEGLVRLFKETKSAVARVHALWTLEGLGKLDPQLIEQALADTEPGVRENAIRLAEPRLAGSPSLVDKLLKVTQDADAQVRFQLLCTLGDLDSSTARTAHEKLLFREIEDPWMQVAALSASSDRAPQLFKTGVARLGSSARTGHGPPASVGGEEVDEDEGQAAEKNGRAAFFRNVCSVIGARKQPAEIQGVIQTVAAPAASRSDRWRAASVEGLARGLRQARRRSPQPAGSTKEFAQLSSGQDLLLKIFHTRAVSLRRATVELLEVIGLPSDRQTSDVLAEAAKTAVNWQADANLRSDSIRLLMLADLSLHISWLKSLVDAREPEHVQAAAARALGRTRGDEIATFLLGKWREMTPQVRAEAGDALSREPGRAKLLLGAIRSGAVPAWTLIFRDKRRLLMHDDRAIRDTARALLAEKPGERESVLKRYQAALDMNGDAIRGKQVFDRVCAKCHQLNGSGGKFGPDLATVRNRTPDALLADIVVPSRSIAQNYEMYVVELASGGSTEGIIASDTPTAITLRHEDGKEDVIARKDIKGMYASTLSAMPADMEKQINLQQMADLLKFLKSGR